MNEGPEVSIEPVQSEELRNDPDWWRIYQSSFPAEELEDPDTVLRALEHKTGVVLRAVLEKKTIGITTLNFLEKLPASFAGYIAVDPSLERMGLGSKILQARVALTREHFRSQGQEPLGVFSEVERADLPDLLPVQVEKRKRRLQFFKKNGGQVLPIDYWQPPLSDDLPDIPMHLVVVPCGADVQIDQKLMMGVVDAMLDEKYGQINGIPASILNRTRKKIRALPNAIKLPSEMPYEGAEEKFA